MSLIVKNNVGSKFYFDTEREDVFEEGADGVFILRRVNGKKERVAVDAAPETAQLLFGDQHHIWEYVR